MKYPSDKQSINNFKILDCTIRDGGYVNDWHFDMKFVREAYRSLSKAGIDYVELGFRGTEKYFNRKEYGIWRFSEDALIREVSKGINGAKIAIMADYGKIEEGDFDCANNTAITLIRLAVHKDSVKDAINLLEKIKNKGYEVSLNVMGISSYTHFDIKNLISLLKASDVDYVYIADSYGSIFPNQIQSIIESFLEIPNAMIGFHPHNNLQMAFANTLEAIRCGAHIIDSSMYGMGRGAGNLPTEIILAYFQKIKPHRYNALPVLNCIDTFLMKIFEDNPWGYSLPFMLSGVFSTHPNYVKDLLDRKRYSMEDIWRVMELIKKKNPIGYSKQIIDDVIINGFIGDGVLRDIKVVGKESVDFNKQKVFVPYIGRHRGKSFLILANGPTLKEYQIRIQAFIEKYNPIVIGANYLGNLIKPHYHAFTLPKRFLRFYDTVAPDSKILLGEYIPDPLVRTYLDRPYERIYYDDIVNKEFDIDTTGRISSNCRTVSVLLIAVSIVMGAEKIYVAGMDGYLSTDKEGHFLFYHDEDEYERRELIIERHHWCAWHLGQINNYLLSKEKEDIHIITPTSYYNFYKGIGNYL